MIAQFGNLASLAQLSFINQRIKVSVWGKPDAYSSLDTHFYSIVKQSFVVISWSYTWVR